MRTWIVAGSLMLAGAAFAQVPGARVVLGQEGHGAHAFQIGGAVRVFDGLEYQNYFVPARIEEYKKLIKPQLDIFKAKLPKLGEKLQRMFERGINPRWFFASYKLRKVDDAGTSALVLTYNREQIALNDDGIIHIQQKLWDAMAAYPQDRALLLVHEVIWSAVGDSGVQPDSGDSVRKLASLILDPHLVDYEPEQVSEEVVRRAKAICKDLKKCPLYTMSVSPWITRPASGWEDLSTEEDNVTATACRSGSEHCVYSDEKTELYWSTPMAGAAGPGSWQQADDACRAMKGWGGVEDWHLPSEAELKEAVGNGLITVLRADPNWRESYVALWTRSIYPKNTALAWLYDIAENVVTRGRKAAATPWVCVAGDYGRGWRDVSVTVDGVAGSCLQNADHCMFLDRKTNLVWSERSPGYGQDDNYKRDITLDWTSAYQGCAQAGTWGGAAGWRLPTTQELATAYRHGMSRLAIQYADGFGGPRDGFWAADWIESMTRMAETNPSTRQGFLQWFDLTDGEVKKDPFTAPIEGQPNAVPVPEPKTPARGWLCVRQGNVG